MPSTVNNRSAARAAADQYCALPCVPSYVLPF